jgi:hypothetical protein
MSWFRKRKESAVDRSQQDDAQALLERATEQRLAVQNLEARTRPLHARIATRGELNGITEGVLRTLERRS